MRAFLVLSALLVTVPLSVFAHGGGLDRFGCHNQTGGSYHCHRNNSEQVGEKDVRIEGEVGLEAAWTNAGNWFASLGGFFRYDGSMLVTGSGGVMFPIGNDEQAAFVEFGIGPTFPKVGSTANHLLTARSALGVTIDFVPGISIKGGIVVEFLENSTGLGLSVSLIWDHGRRRNYFANRGKAIEPDPPSTP